MATATRKLQEFLQKALRYMEASFFEGLHTSQTIKATQLPLNDIQRASAMGKFEPRDGRRVDGPRLPEGVRGVNVFAIPELKGRRRLITEPLPNAAALKHEIPRVSYTTRLARRQSLRYARYMLQIDVEAFYDSIPLPLGIRNRFVLRTRGEGGGLQYHRLFTLPTGARWSVAVGQDIAWVIVDVESPVIVHTMIDKIMIAAREGQESWFVAAVREIVERIRSANLLTSPGRGSLAEALDAEPFEMAMASNVFLGEEYGWNGRGRLVRNSVKTVAKLILALKATRFIYRSFASVVSLIAYALHTARLTPARAFLLLRAYRGACRKISRGKDWDEEMQYINLQDRGAMKTIGTHLVLPTGWQITDGRRPTCEDCGYDVIVFTDASSAGWGAVAWWSVQLRIKTYQQRWVHDLHITEGCCAAENPAPPAGHFQARHSAHAEPRGARMLLQQLVKEGLRDGARVAFVTDHSPIVHAQKRLNGFGGIWRVHALNRLYEYTCDI
ncbi:MAG: hypothetical protein PV362_16540 [Providencia heimbachae]|nr:hypothetical protein [Providencia heimbachae]